MGLPLFKYPLYLQQLASNPTAPAAATSRYPLEPTGDDHHTQHLVNENDHHTSSRNRTKATTTP